MAFFGTSDLAALLRDTGVPIAWGAVTGMAIQDTIDRDMLSEGSVQFTGKEIMVTLETERFAGLKEAETLFVSGAPHRVLQTRQVGDGALLECLLLPIPGAQPAPLRIAKGSDARHDNAFGPAPRVNGVTIAAASTVVVAVVTNGGAGPSRGATAVAWGATALTKRGERNFGVRGMVQLWTLSNASGGTADVAATIPVANGIAGTIWVSEVQLAAAASFDQLWMNFGNSSTPTVTADNPIAYANSILFGAVGQEGEAGPLGSWDNGFLQGHSNATPGGGDNDCQISEGYRVVSSIAEYTVANAGRSSAPWAMLLMSIRGN